jgi:regulator of sirC expression with transglutaminase-like and TPR domain
MPAIARLGQFFENPGTVSLEEALLRFASMRPSVDVDIAAELQRLDRWASEIDGASIEELCDLMYRRLGFDGDREDYYRSENSYLDSVLARRRGVPITLAVVFLALARRASIEVRAIGMPGHFMLLDYQSDRFIDPFNGGRFCQRSSLEAMLRTRGFDVPVSQYLTEVSDQVIAARVVRNLVASLDQRPQGRLDWLLSACAVLPSAFFDPQQLTLLAERSGHYSQVADYLDSIAQRIPATDLKRKVMLHRAQRLRAKLN